MKYKLVAYMQDDDHTWPVTVWSHYETAAEAEKAGYAFVKRYDGGIPRCMCFQIFKNEEVSA